LQLGAFVEPRNATQMQGALKKLGYAADIVPFARNGKAMQLVQIRGFADRTAAAEAAASLRRDTGIGALVLKSSSQ